MWRSTKLLELVRQLPCQHCGKQDGTVCAAHSNQQRDGKGMGIKAHDFRIAALCHSCHMELDQGNRLSKMERMEYWEDAHRNTMGHIFLNGWVK